MSQHATEPAADDDDGGEESHPMTVRTQSALLLFCALFGLSIIAIDSPAIAFGVLLVIIAVSPPAVLGLDERAAVTSDWW